MKKGLLAALTTVLFLSMSGVAGAHTGGGKASALAWQESGNASGFATTVKGWNFTGSGRRVRVTVEVVGYYDGTVKTPVYKTKVESKWVETKPAQKEGHALCRYTGQDAEYAREFCGADAVWVPSEHHGDGPSDGTDDDGYWSCTYPGTQDQWGDYSCGQYHVHSYTPAEGHYVTTATTYISGYEEEYVAGEVVRRVTTTLRLGPFGTNRRRVSGGWAIPAGTSVWLVSADVVHIHRVS